MRRKLMYLILVVLSVGVINAGCGKKNISPEEKVPPVKIACMKPPVTLNPITAADDSALEVVNILYRGMLDWTDKWEPYSPCLADVPTIENYGLVKKGRAAVEINCNLRPNELWSDGSYVDVGDFFFSHQMSGYPSVNQLTASWRGHIKSMTTVKGGGLRLVWLGLDIAPLRLFRPLPKKALGGLIMKTPDNFFSEPVGWQSVVNGPYCLKDVKVKNEKIVSLRLVKNPNYTMKPPVIPHFSVTFFSTREAFESDVFAGIPDVIPTLSFEQAKVLSQKDNYTIIHTPGSSLLCAFFDTQSEFLSDPAIRRALLLSLNRDELVKKLYEGKAALAQSWVPTKHPSYEPVFSQYKCNQKEAIELLKQAGWEKKADEHWKKGDKELKISMIAGKDPMDVTAARFIKESWERLGVAVDEAEMPGPADPGAPYKAPPPNSVIVNETEVAPWTLFSGKVTIADPSRWSSPDYDKFCEAIYQELDGKKRNDMLKVHQQLAAEGIPFIPIVFRLHISAIKKNIKNFAPRGFGNDTWNIEYWQPEEKQ